MKEDWVECKLGELSIFELGGDWGKASDFKDDNYIKTFCIRGSEFRNWKSEKGKTASLRMLKKASVEKRNLQLNDILVEISGGGPEQPVGRTELIDKSVLRNFKNSNVVCTNFLRLIRPTELVSSTYINHYLKYFYSTGEIVRYQAGSNNLRNLKFKDYLTIKVPLPPLPIQRAIVAKIEELFSSLDSGIADLTKAQEQLVVYRQAVLKKAFEGQYSKKEYKIFTIDSLCEVVRGGSPRPAGDQRFYNGDIPFMKVRDISRNKGIYINNAEHSIKEAGLNRTRLVKPNTLLLTNSGATLGIPGITKIETTFNDGIAAFLNLDDNLLYHYYYWFSKTPFLRNLNQGAAQPNLNTTVIGKMRIPIYNDKKEHSKIVREIESRLSVCDKVEESIVESLEKAKALRQSILKKAFEGKLLSEEEIAKCKREKDYEPAYKLLERIRGEKKQKK